MSYYEFQRINHRYEIMVTEQMELIIPFMKKAWKILKKGGHIYDKSIDRMGNVRGNLFSDDHSIYAGIVEGCNKGKMIYIAAENAKFLILLNDKKYTNSYKDLVTKGMRIYRVYEPIDVDCIENSWGVDSTLKWVTKLELARGCFSDLTEYSQDLGEYVHCERPTIERVIEDMNEGRACTYEHSYDGCTGRYKCNSNTSEVQYAATNMLLLGERLEIEGCTAF